MSCPESADVRHDAGCCGECQHDSVNHPEHYTQGSIECIEAIRAMMTLEEFVAHCRGCITKYAWRSPHKGQQVEDLRKIRNYAQFAIDAIIESKS